MNTLKRITDLINQENISSMKTVLMTSIKSHPINADATKTYLVTKLKNVNNFYKEVTGLDELEYYHNRVIELQDSLTEAQNKRREISHVLNDIRKKNFDVQERLHKVNRYSERTLFLELIRDETDYTRKEREVFETLCEQERYERDVFSAFTNAIRDSQEKQRNRLEYAKYIGFGLTLAGALGSYLITTWRTEDLKNVIKIAIRDDMKTIFIETTKQTLQAFQNMNKEHMESQNKAWERLAKIFKSDMESNKAATQSRFKHVEDAMNSLKDYTFRLASKLNSKPPPQQSTYQWTWTQIIGVGAATLFLLGLMSGSSK